MKKETVKWIVIGIIVLISHVLSEMFPSLNIGLYLIGVCTVALVVVRILWIRNIKREVKKGNGDLIRKYYFGDEDEY